MCGGSFANCDGNAANGCETDTRSAPTHCGACGRACPTAAHATATCAAGVCGTRCSAGFGDCDGDPATGCEVDLRTSVPNCGRCGGACAVANGTAGCSAGVCAVAGCASGRGNCDGSAANGCETDLATSPAHCGACGAAGAEVCDGRDNSCDGVVDNGCPTALGGLAGVDFTSPEYGSGNLASTDAACPAGQVARGVFGLTNGTIITQLNVICGTPSLVEDRGSTPYRYNVTVSGSADVGVVGMGTLGTTPFRYVCPGSAVVTSIAGLSSPYLYSFSVGCSTLSVTGRPGALAVTATAAGTSPSFGGGGSGTAFTYGCPSNAAGSASALRGLYGRSTRISIISTNLVILSSVGARCGVASITVR
jgi:hypothetical protein